MTHSPNLEHLVGMVTGLWIGLGLAWMAVRILARHGERFAESKADRIVREAHALVEQRQRQADLSHQARALELEREIDRKSREAEAEFERYRKRLDVRAGNLDRQLTDLAARTLDLEEKEKQLGAQRCEIVAERAQIDHLLAQQREVLEQISGWDHQRARQELIDRVENDLRLELDRRLHEFEAKWQQTRSQMLAELVGLTLDRYAAGHVGEITSTVVRVPEERFKGRIVGREGRNIRAFERATGCDLIVDETPSEVVVSSFCGRRREVARLALERLVADGRIDPSRIEEAVRTANEELSTRMIEWGREAAHQAGVIELHPDLIATLGRLHLGTSSKQNRLQHVVEVARLGRSLAAELGLNGDLAARCGLLHDLGKAIPLDGGDSHTEAGAALLRRCGEPEPVVQAALDHHGEALVRQPYTAIVSAADTLSAARPGARQESEGRFAERVEALERLAYNCSGVRHAVALRAGREIRVLVDPEVCDEAQAVCLGHRLVQLYREHREMAGPLRVVVLRETRSEWVID